MKTLFRAAALASLTASPAMTGDVQMGEAVFNKWCLACHAETPFAPGTIFLSAERGAEFGAIRANTALTPDYITATIRNGQGGMPNFRRTEISETELEALLAYFESLKEGDR